MSENSLTTGTGLFSGSAQLYQRANPIFSGEVVNNAGFIDLLITWGPEDESTDEPIFVTNPGETACIQALLTENDTEEGVVDHSYTIDVIFEAIHPIYPTRYYKKEINVNIGFGTDHIPYVTVNENYIVVPDSQYMVRFFEGGLTLVYTARDLYMVLNLSAGLDISSANPAIVEPFNVIFETPLNTLVTVIKDGTGSAGLNINDITLTNNPQSTNPIIVLDTRYQFILNSDTLTVEYSPKLTTEPEEGILSINGIQPVNGELPIQFL